MLSVSNMPFMLNVIFAECRLCLMLFMLNVIYAECLKYALNNVIYAECLKYALYAEWRLCWMLFMLSVSNMLFMQSVIMLNVLYAECLKYALFVSVIMQNVVMLSAATPKFQLYKILQNNPT